MQPAGRTGISASASAALVVAGAIAVALLVSGHPDHPNLHTALDTGAALISGILAVLFWDMARRFSHPFPRWLALSFGVTFALEAIHVLVTFEWFGVLAPIAASAATLRPATWPPAAYVLPIGIGAALVLWRRNTKGAVAFGITLALLGGLLVALFIAVPRYSSPTLFGITRPSLIGVPILWTVVSIATWRLRAGFRLARVLAWAGALLVLANVAMLYSRAPHDTDAMVAHVGKLGAYVAVLVALMDIAAKDMAALVDAERALADTNQNLELRVRERTEALTASENRFRALIENSEDGIALVAPHGAVTYRSPAANRLLGLRDGASAESSYLDRVHPDDARALRAEFALVIGSRGPARSIQLRAKHEDGTWRTFEARSANMLHDPHVGAVVVNFHDITLRLQAEQAAREGDERFREMAEHIEEAFFVVDLTTGSTLYISPTWSKIWGRPLEQGYDPKIWFEAIHPDDRALVATSQAAVKEGKPHETVFRILRPDGGVRWVRGRAYPVRNPAGDVYRLVGVTEDITELRSAEERFTQAQKMEAVGRLAGGVAHDFNNLLTVIIAETEMVQSMLVDNAEATSLLSEIRSASDSAVGLTRQLLAFSRKQLVEPVVFEFNDVVADTGKMLRRLIGEDVRLDIKLGAGTGSVRADRGQMEQVITNLAINARDAMPEGGALIVETARATLDAEYAATRPDIAPGEYAMLVLSDTGTGMTDEVRAHAFEPFYTTKERGKGTGLGLATCHGIVRQAGGHIAVYSELGVGTTFRVYLPSVLASAAAAPAEMRAVMGGVETILFVEDEPGVRRVGGRILRSLGYTVIEARDAVEALRLIGTYEANVHLLFTDVVLPGMGGRELSERMRLARPDLKVLFASGYTDDVILQHQLIAHDVAMLPKPYNRAALAQKIRAVLDGRG